MVDKTMTFSIVASFALVGREFSGSATIVVLPKGSPPVTPPGVSLEYPTDEQIVSSGVYLTLIGSITQGSNPLSKLQVIDSNGNLLQEWPAQPGSFRVDLERFGSPGRKTLRLRVIDSAGLFGETSIAVLNDNAQLEAQARQFLKKYSCAPDGGSLRFAVTDIPVLVPESLKQYWKLFEEACEFWNKYCSVLYLYPTTSNSSEYVIRVFDETSQNSEYIAVTNRSYNGHEIVSSSIDLYKGWLTLSSSMKAGVLAHELWHALVSTLESGEFGGYFVGWGSSIDDTIIPPLVQKGVQLLYSHSPGWVP
jgi:hypothetical protein